jgi:multiple sugar transport system ATP-binding protein
MARVVLKGIEKRFNEVLALRDIHLEVRDKELLILVGPSGCGKSTTLRIIAGLERPTRGTVRIGERVVDGFLPRDRNVSMVFQNYALYPHMNVYGNLSYGLRIRKHPREEIRQEVKRVAAILGIDHLLNRKPAQLSGGERQRVALGRAIIRRPEVFLFDEPLSNLDAKLRAHMRVEIKRLSERLKTTMIYVTHDQIEAMTLGDRIVVMREGVIQQVGAPQEVYDCPANLFVAEFIGSPPMNLIPCLLQESGSSLCADIGFSPKLRIPQSVARGLDQGTRDVILGIRPEDIYTGDPVPASSNLERITGVVEVIEPLGPQSYLHVRWGSHALGVSVGSRHRIRPYEEVRLALDMDRIHLFDRDTGERISLGEV